MSYYILLYYIILYVILYSIILYYIICHIIFYYVEMAYHANPKPWTLNLQTWWGSATEFSWKFSSTHTLSYTHTDAKYMCILVQYRYYIKRYYIVYALYMYTLVQYIYHIMWSNIVYAQYTYNIVQYIYDIIW